MKRRVSLLCVFVMFLFVKPVIAKTVKVGDTIFTSSNQTLSIQCAITDPGGVGMDKGEMMFRASYTDGTFSVWTDPKPFAIMASIAIQDLEIGKSFKIQGRFSDSLDNWMQVPLATSEIVRVDSTAPIDGTINISVDINITVN